MMLNGYRSTRPASASFGIDALRRAGALTIAVLAAALSCCGRQRADSAQ